MSWMYAIAALASTVAACLEDRPGLALAAGAVFIVCVMRAWKSVSSYLADHARWDSMRPSAMPAHEAETLDELADEPSRTRRIGRRLTSNDTRKGRVA